MTPHPNSLNNLIRFEKGKSGNPAGKPKGTSITARLKVIVEKDEGAVADALVKAAIKAALKGDFRFWQEILNRVDGKLPDAIQHSGEMNVITQKIVLDKPPPGWKGSA